MVMVVRKEPAYTGATDKDFSMIIGKDHHNPLYAPGMHATTIITSLC